MESLSIVEFKNKHTVFVSVFCLGQVLLLLFFFISFAAEPAEQEQRVAERFWEILVKSPKRGTTFDRVYNYDVDTGHAEQLVQRCQNLTKQNPENAKAWLLLGLVAERRGDADQAINAFRQAAQLDTGDFTAPFYLGETLITQGRLREAVDALELSVQRKPGRTEIRTVLQTLGKVYERFGETKKSEDIWNRLEELFPDDPEMLVQIAELQESEGRFDDALKRYEKLIKTTNSEFSRVPFVLAVVDIKLRQGKEQDALARLNALLDELAPNSWLADSVRNRIDRIFVRNDDEAGLADFYRKRYEKHPADFESVRRLTLTLRHLGKKDDAEKLLTKTIEKSPSTISLRLLLIDFLTEQKNIDAACEQYQILDKLSPDHLEILTQWGQLVLQNAELAPSVREAEAVKIWTKIAEAAPDDPVAAVNVADLFLRNKIPDEAEQFYRKAVKLRPNDSQYREYLALFYHSQHQKEKALETLRPLAEGGKRTAENLTQLGNLLLSLNYVAESFGAFRDAAELAPKDLQTQWRFIEALIRQNDFDTASKRFFQAERLIENDEQFESFLKQEVQFLKSSQKLSEAAAALENKDRVPERAVHVFWRLAAYRQAEVKSQAAVTAITRALDAVKSNPSPQLLRFAAELFEQNGDNERAIELYENLAEHDAVWRSDHLKRLASLQIKLGRMEQAMETAKKLMGLSAGNSANIRFYADLLLGLGRRDDAIEILRQALRMEPGDISTLTILAQTLADTGRDKEAIEISWRLFERADHLPLKLSIIEKLADYYQRIDKTETLIGRLQGLTRLAEEKTEPSLCLAKVFETISSLDQARQTLENLLDNANEKESKNPLLLKELVSVAEKQNDLAAATRYQEILCQKSQEASDGDRLFALYLQNGDTEKANKLFLGSILQKADLQDQLESIDLMIRREQYDAVKQVLDFLEIHETENWQIPFRQIAVDSYTGQSINYSVQEFRKRQFPGHPPAQPASPPANPNSQSLWLIPGNLSNQPPFEFMTTAPEQFFATIWRQREFFPVLFRDRLRINERFTTKASSAESSPPKPFFNIESFSDARFYALGWQLKEAIDNDLKRNDVEFNEFRKTVESIRTILSENATEKDVRMERLRFEILLLDIALLDEGRNSLAGEKLKLQIDRNACHRVIWNIVRSFGLEGDGEWQVTAFEILLAELIDERIVSRFDSLGSDAAVEKQLGEILDENCRRRAIAMFPPNVRAHFISFAVYLVKQARDKSKFISPANLQAADQKIDQLLEIWNLFANSSDPLKIAIFERKIAVRCPMLVWLLKSFERKEKITQLEKSLEQTAQRNPVFLAEFAGELGAPFDDDMILFLPLIEQESLETQLKHLAPWILNACDFCFENERNSTISIQQRQLIFDAAIKSLNVLLNPSRFDHGNFFASAEQKLLATPTESMRELLSFSNQMPSARTLRRLTGLEEAQAPGRRLLTVEQIEQMDKLEHGLYSLIDFVLKLKNDLQTETSQDNISISKNSLLKQTNAVTLPKPLLNYQPELIGERIVDRTLLRSLLQDNQFYAAFSPVNDFFFRVAIIFRAMDTGIGQSDRFIDNKPVPQRSHYTEKFRQFLEDKERNGSNEDKQLIADLRNNMTNIIWTEKKPVSETAGKETDKLDKDREFARLEQSLQREFLDMPETLALALLKARAEKFENVVPILDTMELKSPQDAKAREFIAANIGLKLEAVPHENNDYRIRTDAALDRLLNYRLSDQESFQLLPMLEKWGRRDDAQNVLDRLIASATDRRIQNELLHRMQVAGEKQKENAITISLRVLRNPDFFIDSKHFALDSYIYETALKILHHYHQIDSVSDQLEIRFKGLKNKTDSRIMLANLYISLDRFDEAKQLALELAQNPSREADRRTAITSLLQRFEMKQQLEEMNERLLERTGTPPR